jgi:phospholipid/cholesterol/gamma-HCH transport system substrate-binding protein
MTDMKNETGYRWKLGLFVSIALILFAAAVYLIGKHKNMFGNTFQLQAVFKNVNGLKEGNNIRFSGINVGTINNIEILTDTTVKVDMVLEQKVKKFIKKDASASISSDGLMGDKVLVISPGSFEMEHVAENDILQVHNPVGTEEILASVKVTAENAEVITDQLASIFYKINNGKGALSKLIGDAEFARNLDNTMENLEASSKGMNENMEAAKHNILLRGYFKKKKREEEKKKKELEEKKKEELELKKKAGETNKKETSAKNE